MKIVLMISIGLFCVLLSPILVLILHTPIFDAIGMGVGVLGVFLILSAVLRAFRQAQP